MPELPDVEVYREALADRLVGATLRGIELRTPFLLRTVEPAIEAFSGCKVQGVERLAKRLLLAFEGERFLVLHLMIAGRLLWLPEVKSGKPPARITLAIFDFDRGKLALTEAGTKRRASLHAVAGRAALAGHDPGGLDPLTTPLHDFAARLRAENHTIKRALTDPYLLAGIGNAYSDEILHRAKLSPLALTRKLDDAQLAQLYTATQEVLTEWTDRLRAEAAGTFPVKVTAFRPQMTVHGRFRQPCPVCGAPVQRIVYAENEANYCAKCQTNGVVLADRALSRVLHKGFKRTLDE